MDVIEIFGGKPLKGKIRISGSKNSALPILASTLLTNSTVRLTNIPSLSDIFSMIDLLKSLNVTILKKKNMLRLKYGNEISFLTDCKIFFFTIIKILKVIINK